ncbi:MAG: hypothetical protein WD768_01830 [Phycisphaeraceae bacterium]
MPLKKRTFTGIRRERKTRTAVKVVDALSRMFITAAGMGTILAVSLVCLFLVWVVLPLFQGGEVERAGQVASAGLSEQAHPLHIEVDDYKTLAWAVYADGGVKVFRLDTGEVVEERQLFPDRRPTCWSFSLRDGDVAFGFEDARVQFGSLQFKTSYIDLKDIEPRLRTLPIGGRARLGKGVVEVTPVGQFRLQELVVDLKEPVDLKSKSPVRLLDLTMLKTGPLFATVTEDGVFRMNSVREIRNMITRKTTYVPSGGQTQIEAIKSRGLPAHLVVEGRGDSTCLIWKDGTTVRLDTRDKNAPVVVEEVDLTPDDDAPITALTTLIGKMTIVVGDAKGRVSTWFRVKPVAAATTPGGELITRADTLHPPVAARLRAATKEELPGAMAEEPDAWRVLASADGSLLVRQHVLPTSRPGSPVTAMSASKRNRMLAVGFEDGYFDLLYVTSLRLLSSREAVDGGGAVRNVVMTPKNDGVLTGGQEKVALWRVTIPHPEATFESIFTPVWYEGALKPEHVWQSTAGDDAFEPKYGLYPLVFGTLKATVYSMLFAVPLALLAAIYTSEFLNPRAKAKIKPVVEIMASLPSVVLGFLAAIVFAPFVEDIVTIVLMIFVMVPLTVVLSAFLWQLIPPTAARRLGRARFLFILATIPVGLLAAIGLGDAVQHIWFADDVRGWLAWKPDAVNPGAASPFSSPVGGWLILMLPPAILLATMLVTAYINPRVNRRFMSAPRATLALVYLAKFLIAAAVTALLAWLLAQGLSGLGLDPRGGIMDTYIQRNALIVGFVMGFAVIPIIYTICEDALSAVPEHLRAASLGAGATQWQTAIRIIIPTAMSGIFSACMIGLGRAVGETMIVLMAAGNTPIMDWNMFSGFRTLSANIAVELPESVKDGTNYRMLFLAALTLFAMTFAVNTVAEVIRMRFRRRAFQL